MIYILDPALIKEPKIFANQAHRERIMPNFFLFLAEPSDYEIIHFASRK
jgi:hypothetical protein